MEGVYSEFVLLEFAIDGISDQLNAFRFTEIEKGQYSLNALPFGGISPYSSYTINFRIVLNL